MKILVVLLCTMTLALPLASALGDDGTNPEARIPHPSPALGPGMCQSSYTQTHETGGGYDEVQKTDCVWRIDDQNRVCLGYSSKTTRHYNNNGQLESSTTTTNGGTCLG